jgi:hypothetical protein
MMYIDPKDQPISTGDKVLDEAWNTRKALRFRSCQLDIEIGALNTFIDTYCKIAGVNPTPIHAQVSMTVASEGTATTEGSLQAKTCNRGTVGCIYGKDHHVACMTIS